MGNKCDPGDVCNDDDGSTTYDRTACKAALELCWVCRPNNPVCQGCVACHARNEFNIRLDGDSICEDDDARVLKDSGGIIKSCLAGRGLMIDGGDAAGGPYDMCVADDALKVGADEGWFNIHCCATCEAEKPTVTTEERTVIVVKSKSSLSLDLPDDTSKDPAKLAKAAEATAKAAKDAVDKATGGADSGAKVEITTSVKASATGSVDASVCVGGVFPNT